jgi:hypothetical protein
MRNKMFYLVLLVVVILPLLCCAQCDEVTCPCGCNDWSTYEEDGQTYSYCSGCSECVKPDGGSSGFSPSAGDAMGIGDALEAVIDTATK